MKGWLKTGAPIFAVCLLAAVSIADAAFELRPITPAERGSATHLSQALVLRPEASDGFGVRAIEVYGFRPFGMDETAFVAASADFAIRRYLDVGVSYQVLSVLSYSEQTCTLSCRWITGTLRFEPALRLGTVSLDHSVVDRALLFDIACHACLTPDIRIFFGARNPFALGLTGGGERCPRDIALGLGYDVCERFTFGVEMSKEAGFPTSVATGVDARLVESISLRVGIRTYPKEFCMGLGLRLGRIGLDMSASTHMDLGVTHDAGLTYSRR
jgi:hypothetical protein